MTTSFLKGMCYSAFPHSYDPSTANSTCIFFGSDIASNNLKPLWGKAFTPIDGPDKADIFMGRDDIGGLKDIGVNIIRLYDWDPRNDHLPFLDYCHSNGIKVLAPVSNYNLGAYGKAPDMDTSIKSLIESFSDKKKKGYHPAIYGIIIGSELDLPSQMSKDYIVKYTKRWVEIESECCPDYQKLPIGHPVSFAKHGGKYPCWSFWDDVIAQLKDITTRDLNTRLILCPHTYNDANYLFDSAEGSYAGWVDLTYDNYKLPILFCEIGYSRLSSKDYINIIAQQLERSWIYHKTNPLKLLGTCFFQYCDKVWMPDTTEGAFGVYRNTRAVDNVVKYGPKDFSHTDGNNCENESLKIQVLASNPVLNTIKLIYNC